MSERWACALLCSVALVSASAPAVAANPDPVTLKEAQERLREGNRRFDRGDYEGARVAYEQSLALVPHGSTYRNLGTTELKLGDPVSALKHLRLAMKAPDLAADRKVITRKDLDAAYAATGHIAVTTSAGAALSVDGTRVDGVAPFAEEIDVAAGKHTLEAHLGAQSAKMEVEAKSGQVASVEISIPPPAPIPPLPAVTELPPTPPAAAVPAEMPLPDTHSFWNTRRDVGVAVAAAGVLSLGASGIFYGEATSQRNHAASLSAGLNGGACAGAAPPSACGALQNAHDAQNTDNTLHEVFLGVGVAALVGGAALFFWPGGSRAQTAILPFFSPQGGGLQLRQEL